MCLCPFFHLHWTATKIFGFYLDDGQLYTTARKYICIQLIVRTITSNMITLYFYTLFFNIYLMNFISTLSIACFTVFCYLHLVTCFKKNSRKIRIILSGVLLNVCVCVNKNDEYNYFLNKKDFSTLRKITHMSI